MDDLVVLSAFDGHYAGRPLNDGLVLKVIPDETMRGLELRKGTADTVINDISPDIVQQFEDDGELSVVTSPGTDYMYIGLNVAQAPLDDKRVRHAIAYAVNREAIVKHLRRGLAGVSIGILPPFMWAFQPDVRTFSYDPARSRAILDGAGYRDPDGGGPLPRFGLTLKVSTDEFVRLQATVLQQDLQRVGIALDVRSYEFATMFADLIAGNFQMVTMQWVGGAVADPDILRRIFHSEQVPPAGFNRGHFSDPEVDRVLDAASSALDLAERTRLYGEAQRLIAEASPYVSLWYRTNVAVTQPYIDGLRLTPDGNFRALSRATKRKS